MMDKNSAITRNNLTILIEDGLNLSGSLDGTVLRSRKPLPKNKAVRSLLSMYVAQHGVAETNALLFRQLGDSDVLHGANGFYEINEALLSALTNLWTQIRAEARISVAA